MGGTEELGTDVRVVAATNRNLADLVGEGRFREDLYYRLNVIPIGLPPLRERLEDVPLIADHFLAQFAREMAKPIGHIDPEAVVRLQRHHWPGNVRELENVIERAVALEVSDRIRAETLGQDFGAGQPMGAAANRAETIPVTGFNLERHLEEVERNHVERALRQAGGVQMRAAELLGLSFRQFRYLVKKYGLKL